MSSDEEPLSPMLEELFENYKPSSINVNMTDGYNNLWIVLSQKTLPFHFSTSSSIMMSNESLDYLNRLLEGTEKPILTLNSQKPLSNEDCAAIIRNATKNDDVQLETIYENFQQHRRQH